MADQRKQAVQVEPFSTEAGEILRAGGALVRLENETQMQIAVQRPRDEVLILKSALAELDTYPDAAEEAIYSKPVGRLPECPKCGAETHYREKCGKCGADVPQKFAEGLSIRAAESLANRWRNSSFGAQIVADDGTIVDGVAVFCDYEMNTRRAFPFRVSRQFKRRDGSVGRHQEDRFNDLVVRAALSKALREAIVRSLPAGLKHAYEAKAREVMAAKVGTDPDQVKRMLLKFSALGGTQTMIERLIGRKVGEMTKADFIRLRGVANAIEAGEMTAEAAFAVQAEETTTGGTGSQARADELKAQLAAAKVENPPRESENKDAAHRAEITRYCLEQAGGDLVKASEILKDLTAFEAEDGEVRYCTSAKNLGGKWLDATLGKVRQLHREPEPAGEHPIQPRSPTRPPEPMDRPAMIEEDSLQKPVDISAQLEARLDGLGVDKDLDFRRAFVGLAGGLAEALKIAKKMRNAKALADWMRFKQERLE